MYTPEDKLREELTEVLKRYYEDGNEMKVKINKTSVTFRNPRSNEIPFQYFSFEACVEVLN